MRVASAVLLVLGALLLVLFGCRPAAQGTAASPGEQLNTQQQQQIAEILAYLKEKDTSLEALRQEISRLRAEGEDPGGARALREDIQVAKALVSAARKYAADKQQQETQALLERLVPALISLRANLPAARVSQAVERAAAALHSYQPQEAVQIASRNLLQATDLLMKAPPTLAPTVAKDLESVKAQIDKQNLAGADESLLAIIKTLASDESVRAAAQALAAARGAQEALGQGAWIVVTAQLDFLDSLLATLQQKAEGPSTAVSGEQAPTTAGEQPTPAEGQPPTAGQPPAAAPAQPGSEQPAAGTAPAAPAAPAPAGPR